MVGMGLYCIIRSNIFVGNPNRYSPLHTYTSFHNNLTLPCVKDILNFVLFRGIEQIVIELGLTGAV